MTFSRQYEWMRRTDKDRLNGLIPHDCPIIVQLNPDGRGFVVVPLGDYERGAYLVGRFQVVAAFVDGFVRAWQLREMR
jgi:hypothetical protein